MNVLQFPIFPPLRSGSLGTGRPAERIPFPARGRRDLICHIAEDAACRSIVGAEEVIAKAKKGFASRLRRIGIPEHRIAREVRDLEANVRSLLDEVRDFARGEYA